ESGVGERALAVTDAPNSSLPIPHTLNGIDVLKRDNFALLKDKRLGLITNHTGRDRDGNSAIDLLSKAPDVKLVALFSPEHGIRGAPSKTKKFKPPQKKRGNTIYTALRATEGPKKKKDKGFLTLFFLNSGAGGGVLPPTPRCGGGGGRPGKKKKFFLSSP